MASLSLKGKGVRGSVLFEKLVALAIRLDEKFSESFREAAEHEEKLKGDLSPDWRSHHEEMKNYQQGICCATREALCEVRSLIADALKISPITVADALWAIEAEQKADDELAAIDDELMRFAKGGRS